MLKCKKNFKKIKEPERYTTQLIKKIGLGDFGEVN